MRLAREPDLLEVVLRSFVYLEPVHRDKHAILLCPHPPEDIEMGGGCHYFATNSASDNKRIRNLLPYKCIITSFPAKETSTWIRT
jgi:hypothetical protein